MPGQKKKTNPALLFITVLFCLSFGFLLTQSSSAPLAIDDSAAPDMYLANNIDETSASDTAEIEEDISEDPAVPEPTATPVPTATPTPTPSVQYTPGAEKGVWTPSGSNWLFLVDGTAYTGWLTDTDGKRYYLGSDGIMKTGWLDDNGKRYYLNLDGILQTGDITIEGKTYHLLKDGSLEGYIAETTPTPVEASSTESTNNKAEENSAAAVKNTADVSETETSAASDETTPAETAETNTRKAVALTFDDGPSSFTDRLLDCLETNNAKATFFMVGEEIEYFPETVQRMEALGFELGNHTYTHADLASLSPEEMSSEVAATDELLLELTGHGATVLRPPYGSVNDSVRATIGTPMILWSIDTLDWETLDAQQTVDTVLSQVQDGDIILMHDIYSATVDAAEILIPALIEQGYELVTIHELAEIKNITFETGILYGSMY